MIRLLQSGARVIAASLVLAAVLCLVAQGALAHGRAGHDHRGHDHHGHAHSGHVHGHHAHAHHAHAGHTHAAQAPVSDTGVTDGAGQPDQTPTADLDGACCGSITCNAMVLTSAQDLHRHLSAARLAVAGRTDAVLGFVPDGLRRPPRTPALA